MSNANRAGGPVVLTTNYARTARQFRGHLIRELVSRGMPVFVLAPDFDERTREQVGSLGAEAVDVSMQRTGLNPLRDCLDLFRLAAKLRRLGAAVEFSFGAKAVVQGTLAAALAGVRSRYAMIEGLGSYFIAGETAATRRLVRRLIEGLYWFVLRFNARVFFLNRDDRAEMIEKRLVGSEKTVLIPGIGIDLSEFPQVPLPVRRHGEGLSYLLIARLLKDKGVGEYVGAARKIKALYPAATFVLVGSLDTNPSAVTEGDLRRWQDEGVIRWLGVLDDVRGAIADADVYVLPSYREGMPRTILEALAVGRPIITTDVPGCRETVAGDAGEAPGSRPGRLPATGLVAARGNGFLVPARDEDALAEAMERFIANPALLSAMGEASRRLAERRFDVERVDELVLHEMGFA